LPWLDNESFQKSNIRFKDMMSLAYEFNWIIYYLFAIILLSKIDEDYYDQNLGIYSILHLVYMNSSCKITIAKALQLVLQVVDEYILFY